MASLNLHAIAWVYANVSEFNKVFHIKPSDSEPAGKLIHFQTRGRGALGKEEMQRDLDEYALVRVYANLFEFSSFST